MTTIIMDAPKVTDEMAGKILPNVLVKETKPMILMWDVRFGMDLVKYPEKRKPAKYTCPMHPEIIRDEPGDCPDLWNGSCKNAGQR